MESETRATYLLNVPAKLLYGTLLLDAPLCLACGVVHPADELVALLLGEFAEAHVASFFGIVALPAVWCSYSLTLLSRIR